MKRFIAGFIISSAAWAAMGAGVGMHYSDKYESMTKAAIQLSNELSVLRQIHINYDTPLPVDDSVPVGIRNNNPMNIKGKGWKGQLDDRTKTDVFGHAVFQNAHYGLRAGARNLLNMQERSGCDTIRKLVDKYCQSSKMDYITALCAATGLGPDDKFDMKEYLYVIMRTIVRQENGQDPYPESYYIPYTFVSNS